MFVLVAVIITGISGRRDYNFQNFKYDIGTNILIPKCFDHKITFPDTLRHIRQAPEISRIFHIVCGGLELAKSN